MRRNPQSNTLLYLALAGGLAYAYFAGYLKLPGKTQPPPSDGTTEDQCALAVAQHRTDICQLVPQWNPSYNCSTPAATVATVRNWWTALNPPEKTEYGTLCAYAQAMGWL